MSTATGLPRELPAHWREEAWRLRRYGADAQAVALEAAADELAASLDRSAEELISLATAALESGYNADSLRRLVRDRQLVAVRRGRRLFFRRGDLPKKPAPLAGPTLAGYDPAADARRVAGERGHGA